MRAKPCFCTSPLEDVVGSECWLDRWRPDRKLVPDCQNNIKRGLNGGRHAAIRTASTSTMVHITCATALQVGSAKGWLLRKKITSRATVANRPIEPSKKTTESANFCLNVVCSCQIKGRGSASTAASNRAVGTATYLSNASRSMHVPPLIDLSQARGTGLH